MGCHLWGVQLGGLGLIGGYLERYGGGVRVGIEEGENKSKNKN